MVEIPEHERASLFVNLDLPTGCNLGLNRNVEAGKFIWDAPAKFLYPVETKPVTRRGILSM